MSALKIAVTAVSGVVLLLLLRRGSAVYTAVAECGLIVIILLAIIPEIKNLMSLLDSFGVVSDISSSALKAMFKAFAFLAVGGISADICRDNGESAVAGVVEMAVKILSVSCILPVITAVVEIAVTFLGEK